MAEEDNDLEAHAILQESHSTLVNNRGMYDRLLRDMISTSDATNIANLGFNTIRPFEQHMPPYRRRYAWYTESPAYYRWVDEEFQRIVGQIGDGRGRRIVDDERHRQMSEAARVQAIETVRRQIEEENIDILNGMIRDRIMTNGALFHPSIGLNQDEIDRIVGRARHSIDAVVMEPRTRTYEHFTLTSTYSYPKNINSVSEAPMLPLDIYAKHEEPFTSMDDVFDKLAELYSST